MRHLVFPFVLVAVGCHGGSEKISSSEHPALLAYLAAKPIPSSPSQNIQPAKPQWDHTFNLPNQITLRVQATGWISGHFSGLYSDESKPRDLGTPGDYIYPSDLRQSADQKFIFCLASGYLPFGSPEAVTNLYQFDIQKREIIHEFRVTQGLLSNSTPKAP